MPPPRLSFLRKRPSREPPPPEEWPVGAVELDDDTFPEFVDKYPLSAVEFWASWCGPCKSMRPIIRDLAEKYRGRVAIGKVNIERHRELAEGNDVMSIPHVTYFSYGKQVDYSHGKLNRRRLEGRFKDLSRKYG
jgi:thioredoxin 1